MGVNQSLEFLLRSDVGAEALLERLQLLRMRVLDDLVEEILLALDVVVDASFQDPDFVDNVLD